MRFPDSGSHLPASFRKLPLAQHLERSANVLGGATVFPERQRCVDGRLQPGTLAREISPAAITILGFAQKRISIPGGYAHMERIGLAAGVL